MRRMLARGILGLLGICSCLVPMLTAADVTVTYPSRSISMMCMALERRASMVSGVWTLTVDSRPNAEDALTFARRGSAVGAFSSKMELAGE